MPCVPSAASVRLSGAGTLGVIAGLFVSKISIACDPHARAYMDRALAPVGDDNDATLDLLTKTAGASAAIAHIRKVAELTRASRLN